MFESGWAGVGQLIVSAWGLAMLIPFGVYAIPRALDLANRANDRDNGIVNGSANRTTLPAPRPIDPEEG